MSDENPARTWREIAKEIIEAHDDDTVLQLAKEMVAAFDRDEGSDEWMTRHDVI